MAKLNFVTNGKLHITVAALLSIIFSSGSATGTERVMNLNRRTTESKVAAAPGIAQAALAAELALRGEKRRSATMMLAAAELLAELKESPRDTTGIEVEGSESDQAGEQSPSLGLRELTRKAREFANGDAELSALAESREQQFSARGLTPTTEIARLPTQQIGPYTFKVLHVSKILPGRYLELSNIQFEGNEPAVVGAIGDGDGDLDLYVYDGNSGGLIGKDEDRTSTCQVKWTPRQKGPFKIRIQNVGRQWERYVILANW